MSDVDSGAFWSYAHEDDHLDSGGVIELAQRLANEYSLITGQQLKLFVDRSGISWGEEWRSRIDKALGLTTFFIPVITPRYFKRPECRREIVAFHSGAQSLGTAELLLPILYAPIPELRDSNPDELIALASRYQYEDWTDHRLSGPESPQYRRAVHKLAQRLADLSKMTEARQLSKEIEQAEGRKVEDDLGFFDLLNQINALLPEWIEAVESSEINEAQFGATLDLLLPRFRRLEGVPGQGGIRFALLQRLAQEGLPLADRQLSAAKLYVHKSVELDPFITRLVRELSKYPEAIESISDLQSSLKKAQRGIDKTLEEGIPIGQWAEKYAHISRLMRRFAQTNLAVEATIREGNAIVQRWIVDLNSAVSESEGADAPIG